MANFTAAHSNDTSPPTLILSQTSCVAEESKHACAAGLGTCTVERDGFYFVNVACVIFGAVTFSLYIQPAARRLQSLPLRAWRLGWTRGNWTPGNHGGGGSGGSGSNGAAYASLQQQTHNDPSRFNEEHSSSTAATAGLSLDVGGSAGMGPQRTRMGSLARASISGPPGAGPAGLNRGRSHHGNESGSGGGGIGTVDEGEEKLQ